MRLKLSVMIFKLALILLPVIFVDLIFVDVNNVVDIPSEDVTLPIIRLPLELTFPAIVMSALDIKLDALTLPDIKDILLPAFVYPIMPPTMANIP